MKNLYKKLLLVSTVLIALNISLFAQGSVNLAMAKATSASSSNGGNTPDQAVDGNLGTRWESLPTDSQSYVIDLVNTTTIKQVIINWEGAFSKKYFIEVSDDSISWNKIDSVVNGAGGIEVIKPKAGSGRYLRVDMVKRGTGYGNSFFEIQVYETLVKLQIKPLFSANVTAVCKGKSVLYTNNSLGLITDLSWDFGAGANPPTGTGVGPFNVTYANLDTVTVSLTISNGDTIATLTKVKYVVVEDCAENIALNKNTTASTDAADSKLAVDDNNGSRWNSIPSDPQWFVVDLGQNYSITKVIINWEGAYGKSYAIQVSKDTVNTPWLTIDSIANGNGGMDTLDVIGTGRYIRFMGYERGTPYGYSFWEFVVNGSIAVGVNEIATANISASPNPFSNATKINVEALNGASYLLQVYDASGALVINKQTTGNVDLGNDLNSGIYFVQILANEKVYSLKVIKE